MAEKLLVTDKYGVLHLVPLKNQDYYNKKNIQLKRAEYVMKVVEEKEGLEFIDKNRGMDPHYVRPENTAIALSKKEQENEELRKQIELLQSQIAGNQNKEDKSSKQKQQ